MSREKTLVKNTMILTIGNICTKLITFFLLPLYTTILTTEEYGIIDLLNTVVSLLCPIIGLQIEQAVFRKLIDSRNNDDEKKRIISTGVFSEIILSLVFYNLFVIISPLIHNEYKYFLIVNIIVYIFSSLFQQISRGLGKNQHYAISSFLCAIVTIISNIITLVVLQLSVYGLLLSSILGHLICFTYIFVILKLFNIISLKEFKIDILKKLLKYSIPLIPNSISWWIFNASDRIIVSYCLGVGKNGILSAAHKFSTLYITIFNIFNMSWTEIIASHIKDIDIEEFFNKMFNTFLKLFVSLGIGIIACMPIVYPLMIHNKFHEGYYQVPVMIIGSIFNVFIGLISVVYIAKNDTKTVAQTSMIASIINIFVHILLINYIDLFAATISTFLAYFVMSIIRWKDVQKKYFTVKVSKKYITITTIVIFLILIIYYFENTILSIIGIIIAILYAFNVNKQSIDIVYKFIKNKITKLKGV